VKYFRFLRARRCGRRVSGPPEKRWKRPERLLIEIHSAHMNSSDCFALLSRHGSQKISSSLVPLENMGNATTLIQRSNRPRFGDVTTISIVQRRWKLKNRGNSVQTLQPASPSSMKYFSSCLGVLRTKMRSCGMRIAAFPECLSCSGVLFPLLWVVKMYYMI
jgi:hypothetical protein